MDINIKLIKDPMFNGYYAVYVECPKLTKIFHCGLCQSPQNRPDKFKIDALIMQAARGLVQVINSDNFENLT